MRALFMIAFAVIALHAAAAAQQPPIIDREIFFGDPQISGAQISPNGQFITFVKPFHGVRNIWVKERSQTFDQARPLTCDTTRPISSYFWSRDSRLILFVQDKGGDENFRIYAVDPSAPGDPVPPARDLTPMDKVRAMIIDVPLNTPDEIIIGLNDRDASLHDVYRLNLATGSRTLVRKNTENVAGWLTDLKGQLRIGVRQTADGGTELLNVENDKLVSFYSVTADESADPIRFTPDGNSIYLTTNKGNTLDKIQLELFDLTTKQSTFLEKDPENEVDFSGALFSDITNELLVTYYVGDQIRYYPKQKQFTDDFATMKKSLPAGQYSIVSMTADEQLWVVAVSRDVDPGSVYLFDRKAGTSELLYRSRPNLPSDQLAPMKPVRYTGRDGMSIPGYLTLPAGVPPKNLPTIMFVHGGPWARDFWGYNSIAQFLANRGYAVFQPNFRGSTGFGKKFLNAGNKEWGTGAMQHDITDAVKYLVAQGIADPARVGIAGGSYGGYATLAGLAFTPEVYAAGFDIVGPSNIITLLNSIPPYWAPMKKTFAIRVGDKDDPKEKTMLEKQSPLFSAKNIKAPLFVVQGANDPRVKKAESDQIVVALRDLGRKVEYMVAPDEGHGYNGAENRLAMFTAMEQFFAKHLQGRVQTDVRDAISKKLSAITVDISTVTMPKAADAPAPAPAAAGMPSFDGSKVKPASFEYKLTIETRGKTIPMGVTRAITRSPKGKTNLITVIDNTAGMMGGSDTVTLDGATLLPVHRTASQGGGTVDVAFTKTSATGTMKMGAQAMPINASVSESFLTDGAATDLATGTLPLKAGYTAALKIFDLMSQTVKTAKIEVSGKESVTVNGKPAEAWKVVIKTEGEETGDITSWYTTKDRTLVKQIIPLPAMMGGGTQTLELVK
jgi:dipeptidyl aminopeptidase/acylaminoacyl peptidase